MTTYESRRKRRKGRRKKNPVAAEETPRKRRKARRGGRHRARHAIRASKSRKRGRRHSVKGHYRRGGRGRRRTYVRRHMSREEARRGKRRRKRRGHHRRKRHSAREARRHRARRSRENPLTGAKELLSGVAGVAFGYVLASAADRYWATQQVAGISAQETPPQGSIYNSEAVTLPIWSSWQRLASGAVAVGLPLFAASKVRNAYWKSFLQLAGFGALARTAGKAADDGVALLTMKMTTPNPTLVRLYAPEIAAAAKLSAANLTALPAAQTATFAGLPRGHSIGRIGAVDASGLSTTDANGNPFVLDSNGNVVQQVMGPNGTCPNGWSMIPNSEYCGQLAPPSPPSPPPPSPPMNPPPAPPPTMNNPPPAPPVPPLPPPGGGGGGPPCNPACDPCGTGNTSGAQPLGPFSGQPSAGMPAGLQPPPSLPFNPLYANPDGQV